MQKNKKKVTQIKSLKDQAVFQRLEIITLKTMNTKKLKANMQFLQKYKNKKVLNLNHQFLKIFQEIY